MTGGPRPPLAGVLLGATAVALFAIVLSAPPNLLGSNEDRMAAYVWDVVQNGAFVMPRDLTGEPASKPPLYTWLAAVSSLVLGHFSRIPLYLPSAAATVTVAWLLWRTGATRFGWAAGFLGALGYLLSHASAKQMVMARYDALFALTVVLTALAAFRAWTMGRGWTWFWLAAAAATMTKGPLGLVLGAAGLLAAVWERRTGHPAPIVGSHLKGVGLFLAITGGWFLLAVLEVGPHIVDKLLVREVATHAVTGKTGAPIASGFYKPPIAMLIDLAPWSVFGCIGLWRIWTQPARDDLERRFERFLFCYVFTGLVLFSLAAHQRSRLVLPLLPPMALIAGREMAGLVSGWSPRRVLGATVPVAAVALAALTAYYHLVEPKRSGAVDTARLRVIADSLRDVIGGEWMLTHVDSPFPLQFYLRTMRPPVPAPRAAELLRGPAPALAVVMDWQALQQELGEDLARTTVVGRWPVGNAVVHLVSNRPSGARPESMSTVVASLQVTVNGLRVESATGTTLAVRPLGSDAAITVVSLADRPQLIRLRWTSERPPERQAQRLLAPGAACRWTATDGFDVTPIPEPRAADGRPLPPSDLPGRARERAPADDT